MFYYFRCAYLHGVYKMEDYNIIRTLIVLISGMSILLGFLLFKIVTERQGQLKVSGNDSSLELSDVGPGVFFALFGATILVSVLITQPYSETTRAENPKKADSFYTTRDPASVTSYNDNELPPIFAYLSSKGMECDTLEEGIDYLAVLYKQSQSEPYAKLTDTEKEVLFDYLKQSNSNDIFIKNFNRSNLKIDTYYFFSSYLTNYYIKNMCEG